MIHQADVYPLHEVAPMQCCPHCRHDSAREDADCPHCGASFAESNGTTTQPNEPIARFANIAEAGYFHSELEGRMECHVQLNTQDHFDAPSASWWSDYVLTVPATHASEAVAVLKQLVTETDQAEFMDFGHETASRRATVLDGDTPPESRIHWTPIVLTLAAGTFVVWATKQAQQQLRGPVGREGARISLWDKMGESGQPWVQRLDDGRGRREISVDPDQNFATLREDTDGDGILDRVSRLPLSQ